MLPIVTSLNEPGAIGCGDVQEVVGVTKVVAGPGPGRCVKLHAQRRPQRRRRTGAVLALDAGEVLHRQEVEHVAAGVRRDIGDAAPDQMLGVRRRRPEAERPLVGRNWRVEVHATGTGVIGEVPCRLSVADARAGRRQRVAREVVLVPHHFDEIGIARRRARQGRQAAGNELPERRLVARHRERHDSPSASRRLTSGAHRAERRAAHHDAVRALARDIGQAVAVGVARSQVAIVGEHRDVAQRRVDEELMHGLVERRVRRGRAGMENDDVRTCGLLTVSQIADW